MRERRTRGSIKGNERGRAMRDEAGEVAGGLPDHKRERMEIGVEGGDRRCSIFIFVLKWKVGLMIIINWKQTRARTRANKSEIKGAFRFQIV